MKRLKATAALSILGGILIHLAVFTVLRIEPPVRKAPFEDFSTVLYVGSLNREAAPATLQQAALFDSAPLFMPTRWNPASEMAEVASLKEATEIFDEFPAQLRMPAFLPGVPSGDSGPADPSILRLPSGPAFVLDRYGRKEALEPQGASGGPSFLLNRLDDAASGPAQGPSVPRALQALAPPALWTPTQFYFQVAGGIPAGLPVLAQSSGFADWDRALQGFISSLGFYRQLEDGYYHLLVYP
jgi:hypothetical protein